MTGLSDYDPPAERMATEQYRKMCAFVSEWYNAAGYRTIGQLAGMDRYQLAKIEGIGRRHGAFLLYGLLTSWELVKKPDGFCPSCGAALKKVEAGKINCPHCGVSGTMRLTTPEPEAATA